MIDIKQPDEVTNTIIRERKWLWTVNIPVRIVRQLNWAKNDRLRLVVDSRRKILVIDKLICGQDWMTRDFGSPTPETTQETQLKKNILKKYFWYAYLILLGYGLRLLTECCFNTIIK